MEKRLDMVVHCEKVGCRGSLEKRLDVMVHCGKSMDVVVHCEKAWVWWFIG